MELFSKVVGASVRRGAEEASTSETSNFTPAKPLRDCDDSELRSEGPAVRARRRADACSACVKRRSCCRNGPSAASSTLWARWSEGARLPVLVGPGPGRRVQPARRTWSAPAAGPSERTPKGPRRRRSYSAVRQLPTAKREIFNLLLLISVGREAQDVRVARSSGRQGGLY